MASQAGPQELLKTILRGAVPSRPLFLPIVFSHAARIENLALSAFLTNPTKITQALRQMRGHLRSDGLSCYFDPHLESEALGVEPDVALGSLASRGRMPVALEVIRRMKSVVRDDVLLTAAVSGPFRLAVQVMQAGRGAPATEEIPGGALELATQATAQVAKAFVEAGANVTIICEDLPASFPGDVSLDSLLATAINIVRFYQALPVLVLNCAAQPAGSVFRDPPHCVVCPVVADTRRSIQADFIEPAPTSFGVAIPTKVISEGLPSIEKFSQEFRRVNPGFQPAVITTSGDVPDAADLRSLNAVRDLLTG